jgi:hypothetical protein
MISILQRKLCTILCILCTIALVSCTSTPREAPDFPWPPGELMTAPDMQEKLDATKPLPVPGLVESHVRNAGQYRNVADKLARLQFWIRTHMKPQPAPPALPVAARAPVPLVSPDALPARISDAEILNGLAPKLRMDFQSEIPDGSGG